MTLVVGEPRKSGVRETQTTHTFSLFPTTVDASITLVSRKSVRRDWEGYYRYLFAPATVYSLAESVWNLVIEHS